MKREKITLHEPETSAREKIVDETVMERVFLPNAYTKDSTVWDTVRKALVKRLTNNEFSSLTALALGKQSKQ